MPLRENPVRSEGDATQAVSWPLRVAAAWSWRFLAVVAAAVVIIWLASQIPGVILPVAIAMLLSVFLAPFVEWCSRHLHLRRTWATVLILVLAIVLIAGLVSYAGNSVFNQFPRLISSASGGMGAAVTWLSEGPLGLDTTAVESWLDDLQDEVSGFLQSNSSQLASGALSIGSSLVSVVTGGFVTIFCLFFFLKEGRRIWLWVVRLLPAPARRPAHEAAIRGWVTIGGYVTTQIKVAAIDALGIGLGAFFLGLPMVVPITMLVFFGSFIPILGAFLSGAIAVFVAVLDQGLTAGLIMLAVILVVQQIEGNVLQPWLMSDAVSLHPVAVLLVVTGAGSVAGIMGAVFGVPIAAFINAVALYLHGYDPIPELASREDRPGGPPGMLDEMIASSYRSTAPAGVDVRQEPAAAGDTAGAGGDALVGDDPASVGGSGDEGGAETPASAS
ncbi:MAG: AI-2E family transporter [Actinomyces sp.]|jgi:predicted PurR-regulated permease PerM|nr:AI-2E family transporter [Actinomyces sp.]MCI1641703.1 AI-2E family transporter [Actinomyces sp.]MCI1661824.1 AI-2E family transporter [Actinomyces sp.]MCI1690666.1 AI-2E family transporter [Actinomyces sp.]MCI1786734.1 AI-2E family transporter [Actinomyces sp.]MCI1829124.1 AI-2E family transporter [Actinomyces sp.]